jgi:hypothetical protein
VVGHTCNPSSTQEDGEFKVNLGYIVSPYLTKKGKTTITTKTTDLDS